MGKKFVIEKTNIYLIKLPAIESRGCYECGHVSWRIVWKSFIKIGENRKRRARTMWDDMADHARIAMQYQQKANRKWMKSAMRFYDGKSNVLHVPKVS